MRKIALVTGATSGIGKAISILLAQNGFNVIITGRREELLSQVTSEICKLEQGEVLPLKFNICNYNEVFEAIKGLPKNWQPIDLLINNAGLALGFEPLHEGSISDWETMIDTNIKGLLYISRLVSEDMIKRNQGHIINVASVAGREAYASGNVYCATKSAVISLTQGMRIDWVKYGIKVGCISPGMVETNFSPVRFHGDMERASKVYEGVDPLTASDIAEAILFMATRPPHVNIDDMLVMATAQAFSRETVRKTNKN